MSDAESESENALTRDNVTTLETELAQPALTARQRSRVRVIENSPGGEVLLRLPDENGPDGVQDQKDLADLRTRGEYEIMRRELMELRSDMDRIVAATAESPIHHAGVGQFRNSCENSSVGTWGIRHAESSVSNPVNRTGRGFINFSENYRAQSADNLHGHNVRLGISGDRVGSHLMGETRRHGLEGPPIVSCHFREQGDVPKAGPEAGTVGHGAASSKPFKFKKPAVYDGESNWQDYLVHFEMISQLNNWDDVTKAMELATSLRGVAQGVLSDMRPETRCSYRHLVSALANRFQPENQSELYRAQLKNRIRQKGESLTELAQDIKRLTRLAYPAAPLEVRDRLARDCFIDSLNDSEIEWSIFQSKPTSAEDAVRSALEYEAFQQGRRRRINVGRPNAVRLQNEDFVHNKNDLIDEVIGRLATMNNPDKREATRVSNSQRKCYYCGKEGHLRRDCVQRKQDLDRTLANIAPSQNRRNFVPKRSSEN